MKRRAFLGTLALLGSSAMSGCFDNTGVPQLSISNLQDFSVSGRIAVEQTGTGGWVVDEQYRLAPYNSGGSDYRQSYQEVLDYEVEHRLTVTVVSGSETLWTETATETLYTPSQSLSVIIDHGIEIAWGEA